MSAFTYLPKPKPNQNGTVRQTETVHELDYIFFGFGGRISANTTGDFK